MTNLVEAKYSLFTLYAEEATAGVDLLETNLDQVFGY